MLGNHVRRHLWVAAQTAAQTPSVVTQNRPMRVTSKPANEKARDIDSDGSPYRLLRYEQCLERSEETTSFGTRRSEEHTSELQSRLHLVCRLLLEKKKQNLHSRCFLQSD